MARLRLVLAPVAAIWLSCQIGTLALVPVALLTAHADADASECDCGHGPGAMCPMHRKPASRSVPCAMQAADYGVGVPTAIPGIAGLIPEPTLVTEPAVRSRAFARADARAVGERPVPPDPPPPRA